MAAGSASDFWICIEGGGSHTWAACVGRHGVLVRQLGPTSPRSVTGGQARAVLAELATDTCRAAGAVPAHCRSVIAAHGAASTPASCQEFSTLLISALRRAAIGCPVLLTNDLVPLLLGGDAAALVTAVAGTGTGFGARSAQGRWARASGCEYLLSDEGGGFDIGLSGLRAAVRAVDGRGQPTALLPLALDWCGGDPASIADDLSKTVYVAEFKPVIASFAPRVLGAAPDDEVAGAIVARAARELAAGIRAVARSAGCYGPDTCLLLAGSLLTENEILTRALREELGGSIGRDCLAFLPEGWLLAGFHRLHQAWQSRDHMITQLAAAFPVLSCAA